MKVFISWSGELSKAIAQILKKYIPCIIQNAEVFCSSEDIEKGENWDSRLTSELANSCFGIVCLTKNNMNASWINFEAGAIAKTLNSRMTALMINLVPSDIQGPLKRYQATNLDERDMKKLILDINKSSDDPRDESVVFETFEAFWPKIELATKGAIKLNSKEENARIEPPKSPTDVAIEEILQLVRKQTVGLNLFENLAQKINTSPYYYSEPSTTVLRNRDFVNELINNMNIVRERISRFLSEDDQDQDCIKKMRFDLQKLYVLLTELLENVILNQDGLIPNVRWYHDKNTRSIIEKIVKSYILTEAKIMMNRISYSNDLKTIKT